MKKIALILVLIFGMCGSLYAEETVSSDIQILFLKQRIQILEQQIKIRDLQQEAMERTPSELDIAAEVGASANSYDVNTTPSTTADYLLGIDDFGEGSWAVQRFNIQNLLNLSRDFNKLDLIEDTTLSEAQVVNNKYITNQGDAGEAEFVLPDLAYVISVTFIVEEVQNLVVQPAAGELLYLNGTALDADDCVDSDSLVGSMIVAINHQDADGDWNWHLHTAYGAWTDAGDCDP